ncbi:hypothetical protein KY290_019740, partial [Solanum tuberosum]
GLTVVNISATTFPQTLDWLHNHLLQLKAELSDGFAQLKERGNSAEIAKD